MLVVSHTKPLHDAVAQMADDLYGGYAPATPFSINKRFIDRLNPPPESSGFSLYSVFLNRKILNLYYHIATAGNGGHTY
ncbi:MAG TPA: hypothetical protein DIW32_05525 [Eubacterium sp.]|nr:hypothetical protein [Eubacterium sp.]